MDINPDIIHIDECPESFDSFNKMQPELHDWLYAQKWSIVETCHNISFDSRKQNSMNQMVMSFVHHII